MGNIFITMRKHCSFFSFQWMSQNLKICLQAFVTRLFLHQIVLVSLASLKDNLQAEYTQLGMWSSYLLTSPQKRKAFTNHWAEHESAHPARFQQRLSWPGTHWVGGEGSVPAAPRSRPSTLPHFSLLPSSVRPLAWVPCPKKPTDLMLPDLPCSFLPLVFIPFPHCSFPS